MATALSCRVSAGICKPYLPSSRHTKQTLKAYTTLKTATWLRWEPFLKRTRIAKQTRPLHASHRAPISDCGRLYSSQEGISKTPSPTRRSINREPLRQFPSLIEASLRGTPETSESWHSDISKETLHDVNEQIPLGIYDGTFDICDTPYFDIYEETDLEAKANRIEHERPDYDDHRLEDGENKENVAPLPLPPPLVSRPHFRRGDGQTSREMLGELDVIEIWRTGE